MTDPELIEAAAVARTAARVRTAAGIEPLVDALREIAEMGTVRIEGQVWHTLSHAVPARAALEQAGLKV